MYVPSSSGGRRRMTWAVDAEETAMVDTTVAAQNAPSSA
jgi:hypothetical protein